jgi:hypothetical protein
MAVFGMATPAQGQQEPHYLAAISDLRTARDYIESDNRPGVDDLRHHAKEEINKALVEIKNAAWDDGKNTNFAPPQGGGAPWAPMHEAKRYIRSARGHVEGGVDTQANNGLRGRALAHIDEAERTIDRIIQTRNSQK